MQEKSLNSMLGQRNSPACPRFRACRGGVTGFDCSPTIIQATLLDPSVDGDLQSAAGHHDYTHRNHKRIDHKIENS